MNDDLCGVTDPHFVACSLLHGHKEKHKFDRIVEYGTDEQRKHLMSAIQFLDAALKAHPDKLQHEYTERLMRLARMYLDALVTPPQRG